MATKERRKKKRVNLLKILTFTGVFVCIALFLRATILRVEAEAGISLGGLSTVTLGFAMLFVGGVFYGLWMLFIEHYIAVSLMCQLVEG
ncbi:MAG: hypothetical protein K6U74_13825, partial [Firmicutes bacterium]|nr:hypothetical protein [Bacillota bacterium]